jgi:hypothetical protein
MVGDTDEGGSVGESAMATNVVDGFNGGNEEMDVNIGALTFGSRECEGAQVFELG